MASRPLWLQKRTLIILALVTIGATAIYQIAQTKVRMDKATEALATHKDPETIEKLIGPARYVYRHQRELPYWMKGHLDRKVRDPLQLRVYNEIGLPYWQVMILVDQGTNEILWSKVRHR